MIVELLKKLITKKYYTYVEVEENEKNIEATEVAE